MSLKQLQAKLKDENNSFVADIHGQYYISSQKGIAPVINKMKEDLHYFQDAIVVDKVVGKAVAMLLIQSGVKYIYAYVLSQKAKEILDMYQVQYDYEEIVDYIINRDHTGMCPMEQTVYEINDLDEAYHALLIKQQQLQSQSL